MKREKKITAKGKGQRAESKEPAAEGKGQMAKSQQPVASSQQPVASGQQPVASKISTVFNIKKPSAIGIYIPAEGCISESRAIRACLMIRVFNN